MTKSVSKLKIAQKHKNKKWKTKNNGKKTASGPKYNSTTYYLKS